MIKQRYTIKASVEDVWDALVNPRTIRKWSLTKATMSDKKGSKFSLWGGDMHGTNTKIIKKKELHQDWYAEDWEKPTKVVFKLSSKGESTILTLTHSGVPKEDEPRYAEGWDDYYCGAIKRLLEND